MWPLNSTLTFLFTSFGYFYGKQDDIIVDTSLGSVRGVSSVSRDGKSFYKFLGIPYAKAPVGDLRFQAPLPPDNWEGIRDAIEYGHQCIQADMFAKLTYGDEDCLFLNIFTHSYEKGGDADSESLPQDELNPVIVFIHGGAFMFGGSNLYRAKYFMDKNIVLVTINYRLGALGFLNMGVEDIQGNMGLKDQVMSLKWVQINIRKFGGDPEKITIVGESAGAASAHYHLLSPMSKGLFHRAISQSGTALSFWAFKTKPLEQAMRFAETLNCTSEDIEEVSQCLRNISSYEIVDGHLESAYFFHHPLSMYGPTIETAGKDLFLSDHPINIIKSGKVADIPWINGINSEEGLILTAPILRNDTVRDALNANWTKWLPVLFHFDEEPQKVEIANKIREYYLGSLDANVSMSNLDNFTKFASDRVFFQGLHYTSLLHGTYTNSTIYLYLYSYQGVFSVAKLFFDLSHAVPAAADLVVAYSWQLLAMNIFGVETPSYGTCHADELALMFNLPFQPMHKKGSSLGTDYEMSEILVNSWSEFAKNGYPPPLNGNVYWPRLNISSTRGDKNILPMLKISNESTVVDEPYSHRAVFWRTLNMSDVHEALIL